MLFGAGAGAVQTRGVLSHQLVVLRSFFINCHPEPVEGSQQYDKAEMFRYAQYDKKTPRINPPGCFFYKIKLSYHAHQTVNGNIVIVFTLSACKFT